MEFTIDTSGRRWPLEVIFVMYKQVLRREGTEPDPGEEKVFISDIEVGDSFHLGSRTITRIQ